MTIMDARPLPGPEIPEYIDRSLLARLVSGEVDPLSTSEALRVAHIPSERVSELYEPGASQVWSALCGLLGPSVGLRVAFDQEGSLVLEAIPYEQE